MPLGKTSNYHMLGYLISMHGLASSTESAFPFYDLQLNLAGQAARSENTRKQLILTAL